MAQWTADQRAEAVEAMRSGEALADVHRRTGVPKQTLSRWAHEADVTPPGAEQAANASNATRIAWAQRRTTLVDRIGAVVETLLDRIESAGADSDPRGNATAFGILVDKAQLLSGGATSRHEQLDAQRRRERIAELQDEVVQLHAVKDGTTGG